jgi:hypothetical protein
MTIDPSSIGKISLQTAALHLRCGSRTSRSYDSRHRPVEQGVSTSFTLFVFIPEILRIYFLALSFLSGAAKRGCSGIEPG